MRIKSPVVFAALLLLLPHATLQAQQRTSAGLIALYDFSSASGQVVKDRSGSKTPLDLVIKDMGRVTRKPGSLVIKSPTIIRSQKQGFRLVSSAVQSGEVTIEAWVKPAAVKQDGPARIFTFSKDANARNFTLGQDKDRYIVRLRTTRTSSNGLPAVESPALQVDTKLTHIVYTRERDGQTRLYVNGKVVMQKNVTGALSNWDGPRYIALGDEITGGRPWLGEYYLVALYNRNLSPAEVGRHFAAGAKADANPNYAKTRQQLANAFFHTKVAPLLVRKCFECHDTANKQGGLDLSRKTAALAGGESGKVIHPGKPDESQLFTSVVDDEMPQDREPLTAVEKQTLKQWIADGASYPVDVIDAASYPTDRRALQNWVRRLTVREYIATVHAATGVDVGDDARRLLPPDLRADGFSNTAYNLNVDLKHTRAFAQLATLITQQLNVPVFVKEHSGVDVGKEQFNDATIRKIASGVGLWLLRGPLDEHELASYLRIADAVAANKGNLTEAASYIVEGMLQAPRFVYRIENQRGDGGLWPTGNYELATRLSYLLWGAPPDKELLRAAGAGELTREELLREQIARMLEDPRTVERSTHFIAEWLNLNRLANLRPSKEHFPQWDPQLAGDMREETIAYFKEVVWKRKLPLTALLNAQVTFVTPALARHYGLKPQKSGSSDAKAAGALQRYELQDVPSRGGLLTQGSVLTVGGDEASMVSRGLFVLHDLLRGAVKDPPPCVDTTPVPTKPGLTQRGIAASRIANKACGGCHSRFEPLAFGLEKFDGVGAFSHADEHGNKLRDDGEILFPGESKPVPYSSSKELMDLLARSKRVQKTITWKVVQFSLGRPLTAADTAEVDKIHAEALKNGGDYRSLITAIAVSDLITRTRTVTE